MYNPVGERVVCGPGLQTIVNDACAPSTELISHTYEATPGGEMEERRAVSFIPPLHLGLGEPTNRKREE